MQLLVLTWQQDLVIGSAGDFAKFYSNPEANYTLTADIELGADTASVSIFRGVLDGRNHTITVNADQPLFASIEGALLRDIKIVATGNDFATDVQSSVFRNVHFSVQQIAIQNVKSTNFTSCSFKYNITAVFNSSEKCMFSGVSTAGSYPLVK